MVDDSGAGEKHTNLYKQLQPNADAISKTSELSKMILQMLMLR